MNTTASQKPEPALTTTRLKWAGLAAFIGCAACCALPMLALAFAGTGAATTITRFVQPGSELFVGGAVFAVALAVMAIRSRLKRDAGCGPACKADGGCCDRGAAPRSAS
jgi:cation transporter-like permease